MTTYKKTSLERIEYKPLKMKVEKLPLVLDDWTLAFRMGFTGKALWYTMLKRDSQYKVFKIRKASGGLRTIHNPKPIMRLMTKQLRARFLLPLCKQLGPHVGAYQIGKATRDTAKRHLFACPVCDKHDGVHTCNTTLVPKKKSYKLAHQDQSTCAACQPIPKHACPRRGVKIHMDLKDFFTSTRRSWIRKYFNEVVGYNHYVSSLLAHLLTAQFTNNKTRQKFHGVPQGSLSSGDICNIIADWRLDQYILKELPDWQYSRYADDLYFSNKKNLPKADVDTTIAHIERLVQAAGYRVNRKKLHVQRPNRRQKILGIVLNQKLNIPKEEYRKFRSLLNNCIKDGFEAQLERAGKENVPQMQSWISGKLAYFHMVAPERAEKLKLLYTFAKAKHKVPDDTTFEVVPAPLEDVG